ncbi:hypothetical protein LHJ74_30255 [Streptomyces sp. N2-109]|uniref:Lipoprotein n=1 Tax=Streptomyces gossypii TaxID=2883101 RepID=A0ABT2K1U8_9ACTN|nr:hypothetical protein [Streptomyces gossypii]MCT2594142.1 hypothetical protein [Streptomyces gossypii]
MPRSRSGESASRRGLLLPALALATAVVASACTGGEKEEDSTPAAQLCHSSLNAEAQRALDTLSRDDSFQAPEGASFETARDRIVGSEEIITSRTKVCLVYSSRSTPEHPLIEIEFAHLPEGAGRAGEEEETATDTGYPLGEAARASASGADLTFLCGKALAGSASPRVGGHVNVPRTDGHAKMSDAARAKAAMTILHSVSRAMATAMGCGEEANLPERLPAPSS